jgi:hypothetical protein
MALLHERAGRLTTEHGGFWPGQTSTAVFRNAVFTNALMSAVQTVKPAVVSMDFYPAFPPSGQPLLLEPVPVLGGAAATPKGVARTDAGRMPQSKDGYGQTLAVLRQQAEAAPSGPVPFWTFFNAMPYDGRHTDPTEAMLRWQAMTALAYGASGVMYFCYWSPDQVFKLGGGLIVPRGTTGAGGGVVYQRGPHWYEAQRLNSVLKIYGNYYPRASLPFNRPSLYFQKGFSIRYGETLILMRGVMRGVLMIDSPMVRQLPPRPQICRGLPHERCRRHAHYGGQHHRAGLEHPEQCGGILEQPGTPRGLADWRVRPARRAALGPNRPVEDGGRSFPCRCFS